MNRFGSYSPKRRPFRGQTVTIIVLASLLIMLVAFLIIGNILYGRSNIENEIIAKKNHQKVITDLKETPTKVNGGAMILSGATGQSSLNASAAKADDDGINFISVCLNDKNGNLTYRSALSSSYSDLKTLNDAVSVSSVFSAVSSRGKNASALLYLRSPEKEGAESLLLAGEEAAVAVEALENGAEEVVLRVETFADGDAADLLRVFRLIREKITDKKIGVSLPASALSDDNVSLSLEPLLADFDFFCLELTDKSALTAESMSSQIISCRLAVLRYGIRILIPVRDDTWKSEVRATLDELGIERKMFSEY